MENEIERLIYLRDRGIELGCFKKAQEYQEIIDWLLKKQEKAA